MMDVKACPNETICLGRTGENGYTRVLFNIAGWNDQYPDSTFCLLYQRNGDETAYPVPSVEIDGDLLIWNVTNADLSTAGKGSAELIMMSGTTVIKSAIYKTCVLSSLDGSGDVPDEWESWQEVFLGIMAEAQQAAHDAETAADAVENMSVSYETLAAGESVAVTKTVDPETGEVNLEFGIPTGNTGAQGPPGTDGDDGISPSVEVTSITGGHRVSVTDAGGTTTFDVMDGADGMPGQDGADGTDGISPSVEVTSITGGHRVTVTDAEGSSTFDVMDGEDGAPGQDGADGTDGISPSVEVTSITGGHRVTVTDAEGSSTFDVMDGDDGAPGQDGADGTDGVSPSVEVTSITGGHRVTVTDAEGSSTFDVMDGEDGSPGQPGADGSDGADGADGVTFTPAVSSAGVISWTNDGGKTNPQSVDLVAAVISALPSAVGRSF